MQKPLLVAVDTNFPLLLAGGNDDALDALDILHTRVQAVEILVTPTVLDELLHQSERDSDPRRRKLAESALTKLRGPWDFHPAELTSTQEVIAVRAAQLILDRGLLPRAERNDAAIIAESAVLNAILLVSNDSHLLDADHKFLGFLFRELDLPVPLIMSPREIVQNFSAKSPSNYALDPSLHPHSQRNSRRGGDHVAQAALARRTHPQARGRTLHLSPARSARAAQG